MGIGRLHMAIAACAALVVLWTSPSFADAANSRSVRIVGATKTPIGARQFCRERMDDCVSPEGRSGPAPLVDALASELDEVNRRFNREIAPALDSDVYHERERWTYPDGRGDCEDFALAKRRELIGRGWSPATLLMTMVRQRNGEAHAVLLAITDRGDLVLDNLSDEILSWDRTPYRFVKMQTPASLADWVAIEDDRPLWQDGTEELVASSTH